MKKHLVLIILLGVLLVSAASLIWLIRAGKISPQAAGEVATLALSPSTGNYTTGNNFTVNIILNTGGQATSGTDVDLNYNLQDLEVQDANAGIAGVQIQPGTLYAQTVWNSVNTTTGKISFSGLITPGSAGYNGTGTLASITFRALRAASPSAVSFDFTLGATNDSNVILFTTGTDITDLLGTVTNGNYTLVPPAVPTTVRLQLQGRTNPSRAATSNTVFEIRNVGQLPADPALFSKNDVSTNDSGTGTFTITNVPAGNYNFRIRVGYYLTRTLSNIALTAPLTLDFGTLRGGDFNNDNTVNTGDFNYMVNRWGGSDPVADINQDNEVNNADFTVINANWTMQGN